jgi:hypothetical protein
MFKLLGAIAALALLTGLAACGEDSGSGGTEASHEGFAALRTPASASALQTELVKIVKTVSPEVVQIQCGHRLGAGVVFDDRGNVVTNAHVVGRASGCAATLSDGDERSATVVGAERTNDLAVVHASGDPPKPATFADSSQAQIGDIVLAMGNPLGLRSSVTEGIVSALNRSVDESNSVKLSPADSDQRRDQPGKLRGRPCRPLGSGDRHPDPDCARSRVRGRTGSRHRIRDPEQHRPRGRSEADLIQLMGRRDRPVAHPGLISRRDDRPMDGPLVESPLRLTRPR